MSEIRCGLWNSTEKKKPMEIGEIPKDVRQRFESPDGDWDWWITYSPEGWIVVRLYDEGEEVERMICRIVERMDVGEW